VINHHSTAGHFWNAGCGFFAVWRSLGLEKPAPASLSLSLCLSREMRTIISSTLILFSTLTKLISPSVIDNYDITVIGTVGGYLHAVDTVTLEKIWSVNIGGPLLSAQEVRGLLSHIEEID
jgi:hypothetical protein